MSCGEGVLVPIPTMFLLLSPLSMPSSIPPLIHTPSLQKIPPDINHGSTCPWLPLGLSLSSLPVTL